MEKGNFKIVPTQMFEQGVPSDKNIVNAFFARQALLRDASGLKELRQGLIWN